MEDALSSEKMANYRKKRMNELAQPKDKWAVGR